MLLPFTCPLDYLLPPGRLDDDPARFGPALDVREHGFLEHPRAAWLRKVRRASGAQVRVRERPRLMCICRRCAAQHAPGGLTGANHAARLRG